MKETVPVGSVIGLFTFTDEDKVGVHKVTLSNNANGQFSIAPKTGGGYQVILQKQLDYNKKTSYSITILVTNPGSPTFAVRVCSLLVHNLQYPLCCCVAVTTCNVIFCIIDEFVLFVETDEHGPL